MKIFDDKTTYRTSLYREITVTRPGSYDPCIDPFLRYFANVQRTNDFDRQGHTL